MGGKNGAPEAGETPFENAIFGKKGGKKRGAGEKKKDSKVGEAVPQKVLFPKPY